MRTRIVQLVATTLCAAMISPAQATCTRPTETILPAQEIVLVSPKGKTLSKTTGPDGTLMLKGLRKGKWQVRFADQTDQVPMTVTGKGKGKLSIQSISVSYSCSPPGGPVHHSNNKALKQLNMKKKS